MAILLEFYNIIMPISVIDQKYPGGFRAFKESRRQMFEWEGDQLPSLWHDEHLCRVGGAMDPADIDDHVKTLKKEMDIDVLREHNGKRKFKDVYIDGAYQGAAYQCDWISEGSSLIDLGGDVSYTAEYVHLSGTEPGQIIPL